MSTSAGRTRSGVNPILPTPFADDGALDLESLRRLTAQATAIAPAGVRVR